MNYGAYRSCAITYYFQKLVTSTMYNKSIVWPKADSYRSRVNFFTIFFYTNSKIPSNYFIKISNEIFRSINFLKTRNHFQNYYTDFYKQIYLFDIFLQ